jgi:hypothetical protein
MLWIFLGQGITSQKVYDMRLSLMEMGLSIELIDHAIQACSKASHPFWSLIGCYVLICTRNSYLKRVTMLIFVGVVFSGVGGQGDANDIAAFALSLDNPPAECIEEPVPPVSLESCFLLTPSPHITG